MNLYIFLRIKITDSKYAEKYQINKFFSLRILVDYLFSIVIVSHFPNISVLTFNALIYTINYLS